jgi:hypothetical protein
MESNLRRISGQFPDDSLGQLSHLTKHNVDTWEISQKIAKTVFYQRSTTNRSAEF